MGPRAHFACGIAAHVGIPAHARSGGGRGLSRLIRRRITAKLGRKGIPSYAVDECWDLGESEVAPQISRHVRRNFLTSDPAAETDAMFRDLVPGGAPLALTAAAASQMLSKIRPTTTVERARKQLARDLVKDLKALDASLARIEDQMKQALAASGSRLASRNSVTECAPS